MISHRHTKTSKVVICVSSLLTFVLASPLFAGDEDMSPSAYHVFDPETGYMMTVDPLAEEQPPAAAADNAAVDIDTANLNEEAKTSTAWLYWIAVFVVVAGIAIWLISRRNADNAPAH